MISNRLLIASNRLPVTAHAGDGGVELVPSAGGLAAGLRPWHQRSDAIWFGWPGDLSQVPAVRRAELDIELREAGFAPVHLSPEQVDGYYRGFTNRVLWPLFHYSIDRVPTDANGWTEYQEVNAAFAHEIACAYRPGDTIWIHDYHLMLLPALLRQRLPGARIGFFLHIPFPASEVFRVLPWRHEILHGLLGADLVGFHTFSYMRHFMTSLLHVDGVEPDIDRIHVDGRAVRVGVFPMGIDAGAFDGLAADADVRARVEAIRQESGGRRIVLGVDRLDYTKGIPMRLEALARVLEREPALRDEVRYIQVAVPSRSDVDCYERFRRDVEETVGRINGAYGTLHSLPIHYIHQAVSPRDLVALYGAADVMLVTPLRDGMNLVAKEYAASRADEDGVLVLSEFAGAAAELQSAVTVNPFDVDALADSIRRGLAMPRDERRARMRALRRQVHEHDVFAWVESFVQQLHDARPAPSSAVRSPQHRSMWASLADARRSGNLRVLLDYDGTLVPIARSPELAVPDEDLLILLEELTDTPGIEVDIVSGRPREPLERWFGHLPVGLWAEHGFWRRRRGDAGWVAATPLATNGIARVKPLLDQFVACTPGSHVEEKTASMAWHYRGVARDFGARQAHELRLLLGDLLSNQPMEVLEGKKVIEVRMRGVGKGTVPQRIRADGDANLSIVAFGDDRTDEELFRALPPDAIAVAVGRSPSEARFHVSDYRDVRRVLRNMMEYESPFRCAEAVALA